MTVRSGMPQAVKVALICCSSLLAQEQPLPRGQWGAPLVSVSHADGKWLIAGRKNQVTLDNSDLAMSVQAGPVAWRMGPSTTNDMLVSSKGEEFPLRLADAGKIEITPLDTGARTGVKVRLERFRSKGLLTQGAEIDLALCLTVCLEGKDEELVCEAVAIEREASVKHLDWPKEMGARGVNYTALSHVRGNLLPGDWPQEYHPYRNVPGGQESLIATDTSIIQSNLIECWSMSWWGFQKGESALVLIVETSDDAAYTFSHPAGGPTRIGPRWLASLGKLRYPRSVRLRFFPKGDYVTMCKRYRQYVMDTGQFVSLKEKITREPLVARLIGTPHVRQHALRNYKPDGHRYDPNHPERNYRVTTFDELAQQLREMKARGVERAYVTLAGWPYLGYDRQHPDVLPPAPAAGGWEGLQRWVDTCKELGYLYNLHDQYRDYYVDAPSYDPQFAVHEVDTISPPTAFPGTRFGTWKEGYIPFMDYWDGGKMAYLNARYALEHLVKNYQLMFDRGIHTQGSYLDVFGYVPPTEDFNPEHPLTRADCMKYRAQCFRWARNNLGIVGTEAGADWVVPYVDYSSGANAGRCISAPLYNLVYHDAIMTPEGGTGDYLRCLLNGGYPTVGRNEESMERMRQIAALHERVALLEMTDHEFLDKSFRKERSTFADGTTVTIDRDARTVAIEPPLELSR
ncbi:MAG: hypothetical protein JW993_14545 [Sedimentisphaerales bacterium]|nr:hypothetical protein [Sedimentisphaerales bacterium]